MPNSTRWESIKKLIVMYCCSQHYLRSSLWNNGSVVTIDLLHRMFCQTKSTRLYKHCRSENDKWESNWENSCTPWPAAAQSALDRENRIVHRDAKSSRSGRYICAIFSELVLIIEICMRAPMHCSVISTSAISTGTTKGNKKLHSPNSFFKVLLLHVRCFVVILIVT